MSNDNEAPSTAAFAAFDHAPWAVTELHGESHRIRFANTAFCRLVGKSRHEVVGQVFADVAPSPDACLALIDQVLRTGAPASYMADEAAIPCPLLFSCSLWPVKAGDRTLGVMLQVNESGPVHRMRLDLGEALLLGALRQDVLIEDAASLNAALNAEISIRRQREIDAQLLAEEVAHRVKNNLQIVAALINHEIRRTPEPWAQGYRAMQDRIIAIARLYELMSHSVDDRTILLGAYLKEIVATLSASLLRGVDGVRIVVEAETAHIDSRRAVAFGLLVNELVTNAVKHAFPAGVGRITVGVRRRGTEIELTVADDGIGIAADTRASTPGKHGSGYVEIFIRQLRGAVVRSTAQNLGTSWSIVFPASDPETPSGL